MTSFIEKLVNNELPTSGLKPNFSEKELLRPQKELPTPDTELGPTIRGFYQRDWVHGDTSQDNRKNYFLEIAQRFKIGKFFWEPQFVFQSGNNSIYSSSLGLELGNLGEVQVTRRAGLTEVSHYFSTHKNNDLKNGLNSRVALSFKNLQSRPNLRLSSAYTHTLDVLDRKENKLKTKTSLYGVDTSLAFPPFQQTSYSLYYQSKTSNYDFITAFLRKSADDNSNYYSNNFVTGIKYKASENLKFLARASYNVEDRHPRLDLMLKNTTSQDSTLKTFHGISTDLKATSGFIFGTKKFRLQGLARVNFGNNDPKSQPFSLSLKLEANDQTTYSFTVDQKVIDSSPSK